MNVTLTAADLTAFEEEIASLFEQKKILSPVHLSSGNEASLIKIFEKWVNPEDWLLGTWRAHLHALLKGVPREEVKQAILDGRSIALSFPSHRILCSAIVGGMAPIAVGIALGIKRMGGREKVCCFVGDMAAHSGTVIESMKYAANHALPVLWLIEDNGLSVCTPTEEVWGMGVPPVPYMIRYSYKSKWPHVGTGTWISFP